MLIASHLTSTQLVVQAQNVQKCFIFEEMYIF